MRLSFARPYLSLLDLPDVDLPPFTLITGVNGAGKSHLLKAIKDGAAVADIAPYPTQEVRLFDWTNLSPPNEGDFDASTIRNEQLALYNIYSSHLAQDWALKNLYTQTRNMGLRGKNASDIAWLVTASETDLSSICNSEAPNGRHLREALDNLINQMMTNINNNISQEQRVQLQATANATHKHPATLKYDDFLRTSKPAWGATELFQQSFARLFVAYRELYQVNRLAQMEKLEKGANVVSLTNAEFEEAHGAPPWEFVNTSLLAAGLDFTIDAPDIFSMGPYRPRLRKNGTDAEINFDGLSSGERVLMSFAFAVYYASDARQIISRPKLLLLDEVDAPLHPSMCKNLLSTIQHVLVGKYDLNVIMTTHSPSTIALAPEEAIHVMKPGVSGVFKAAKDAALKDLTAGVPTLSLSYDGRRQIFVESPKDVDVYQACYDVIKPYVNSEVTPNFIATGVETSTGSHVNTGCDVVKRIVNDLRASGAKHTVGLLDWDGKNQEQDGIYILAEGERNGLESVIFDPLLLLNTVARHIGPAAVGASWPGTTTYLSIADFGTHILQDAVDAIQLKVLGRPRGSSESISYIGGFTLLVDTEYLTMDDHLLESKVESAFPPLKMISRGRAGELMKWISRTIISERAQHVPICLVSTFQKLVQT